MPLSSPKLHCNDFQVFSVSEAVCSVGQHVILPMARCRRITEIYRLFAGERFTKLTGVETIMYVVEESDYVYR